MFYSRPLKCENGGGHPFGVKLNQTDCPRTNQKNDPSRGTARPGSRLRSTWITEGKEQKNLSEKVSALVLTFWAPFSRAAVSELHYRSADFFDGCFHNFGNSSALSEIVGKLRANCLGASATLGDITTLLQFNCSPKIAAKTVVHLE